MWNKVWKWRNDIEDTPVDKQFKIDFEDDLYYDLEIEPKIVSFF